MKRIFSVQGLITISVILLSLIIFYLLLQIVPHLSFLWHLLITVSLPFLLALIIAYLLHPLVDLLMKCGLNRTISILILYCFFFGVIFLFIWWTTPIFITQVQELISQLPAIEEQLYAYLFWLDLHLDNLPRGLHNGIENAIGQMEKKVTSFVENFVQYLGESLSSLFILFIVPFLVFYFLQDAELIGKVMYLLTPPQKRKPWLKLWRAIDHALGEYIRGQIIVALLVGSLAWFGYTLISLPFALFLAFFVSVTNIIPYFGPFIGATPAVLVALLTKPSLIIWVVIINTLIQILEGNLLSPFIVGKRLAIHPLFIILVLLVGAEIGGVLGLIFAVPIFVILREILSNTILHMREYKAVSKIDRL